MEANQKKMLGEEKLELVKEIRVSDWNRGPHYEIPAEIYYMQLEAFERLYNVKMYRPDIKRGV